MTSRRRARPPPPERSFGVEVGLGVQGEQAPGLDLDDDHGAREVRAHRLFDRARELDVDGEPEVTAGDRILALGRVDEALGLGAVAVAAVRVDDALFPAAAAAQVTLPGALHAGGAQRVAEAVAERVHLGALFGGEVLVAFGPERIEALLVDLGDVAEHVRAEVLVRVVADRLLHDVGAGDLVLALAQLGDDVARDVFTNEHGAPAGRAIVVGATHLAEALLDALFFFRGEPEHVGDLVERVGLGIDDAALLRARAGHHAPRHHVHVVGRSARREDAAFAVADDAAGGGQRDAADDVLVGDLRVLVAADDLQLEEPPRQGQEREQREEREPLVAFAKLGDVRAGHEKQRHVRAPRPSTWPARAPA